MVLEVPEYPRHLLHLDLVALSVQKDQPVQDFLRDQVHLVDLKSPVDQGFQLVPENLYFRSVPVNQGHQFHQLGL